MKSAKPTYCQHCWTELTVDDTTCYQCGEAVDLKTEEQPQQEAPFITKLIWLFCFAVIGGVATAWMKGEL